MALPVFLSIRNKATRLPGKSFLTVAGRPAVEFLAERLALIGGRDQVVICTSIHDDDAIFDEVAERLGVGCFHGSEDDKLQRYLDAARERGAETMLIVDGDDLLCDPRQARRVAAALEDGAEFAMVDRLPLGATAFGLRSTALAEVVATKAESDTEVWGGYFVDDPARRSVLLEPDVATIERPHLRLTLDYDDDLQVVRTVIERLGGRPEASLEEVVAVLDADPLLAAANAEAHERYLANIERVTAAARAASH